MRASGVEENRDKALMAMAIRLAREGTGLVEPNPPVGAVVARGNRVIATGSHRRYGGPHAERAALSKAGTRARGATLYVTLEPCSTSGKTAACVPMIIESGIRRVVVGAVDPDPRHRGRGLAVLRAAGIDVLTGVLRRECRALLDEFERWLSSPLPLIETKWAMSLDGCLGFSGRDDRCLGSAVLSSRQALGWARGVRSEFDLLVIGAGTLLADDPSLGVPVGVHRLRPPTRAVIDARIRPALAESRFVRGATRSPSLLITSRAASASRVRAMEARGLQVLRVPESSPGRLDLRVLCRRLKRLGFRKILIEGGPTVLESFLARGLVDRASLVLAARILGGTSRRAAIRATSAQAQDRLRRLGFAVVSARRLGQDVVIRYHRSGPR